VIDLDRIEEILTKKLNKIRKELDYNISNLNRNEKQLLAKEVSHKLRISKKEAYIFIDDL